MKIVILTNDYPPHGLGGAAIVTSTFVHDLRARGYEVEVVVSSNDWRDRSWMRRLLFHFYDLGSRADLVTRIRQFKPDILWTHNLMGCGFGTAKKIQRQGIRWIHTLHDVQLVEPSGKIVSRESFHFLRQLTRRLWSVMHRLALGRPHLVLSPTKFLLDFHQRYGFFLHHRSEVLVNPIEIHISSHDDSRQRDVVYVGRLDRDKGVEVLIKAWKKLGDDRPQLHLIGQGELSSSIVARQDSKIVLHGSLAHDRVLIEMSKHHVLVFSSLILENQPTVLLEALAAGCHIIASDVGGVAETLKGQGRLVPPGDVTALSQSIKERLDDRNPLDRPSLDDHRVDTVLDRLESFLRSNL